MLVRMRHASQKGLQMRRFMYKSVILLKSDEKSHQVYDTFELSICCFDFTLIG